MVFGNLWYIKPVQDFVRTILLQKNERVYIRVIRWSLFYLVKTNPVEEGGIELVFQIPIRVFCRSRTRSDLLWLRWYPTFTLKYYEVIYTTGTRSTTESVIGLVMSPLTEGVEEIWKDLATWPNNCLKTSCEIPDIETCWSNNTQRMVNGI